MRQPGVARAVAARSSARISDVTAALSAVIDDRITLSIWLKPPGARPGVDVGQSYLFAPPGVGLMFVLWGRHRPARVGSNKEPTIRLRTNTDRPDRVIGECRGDGYPVDGSNSPPAAAAVPAAGRHVERPTRTNRGHCWASWFRHRRAGVFCSVNAVTAGQGRGAPGHQRHIPHRCTTTTASDHGGVDVHRKAS